MSSDGTFAMLDDVDELLTDVCDSIIDADDYMMNAEPPDIDEVCEALDCEVEDCRIEKPSINESFEPYVGMEFSDYKEAYDFYNIYGYANGFSIRRGASYKNIEDKITSIRIVCSKSGLKGSQKVSLEDSIPVNVNVESNKKTPQRESSIKRCENKMTFKWLFETWLQAMGGKHPKAIITDQDPAMKVAIEMVFPNTIHRRCQWHVLRKARDHLGVLYGSEPGFKAELVAIIEYSLTVSDFEKNWGAMVKKYQLEDNSHLKLMFKNSSEWVPAYFREIFMANMSTSQRSESMNAAMKVWMTCNTSLYRFAVQFDKLVQGIYEKESDEDIRTMNETPIMCSCDPIEAEARKVYTRNVFSIFKEKVRKSTAYRVREVEKDKVYEVRPAVPQIKYEW